MPHTEVSIFGLLIIQRASSTVLVLLLHFVPRSHAPRSLEGSVQTSPIILIGLKIKLVRLGLNNREKLFRSLFGGFELFKDTTRGCFFHQPPIWNQELGKLDC